VVRELLAGFGNDLRYVFRHLPPGDVHEHAQPAAEATEAAGAQGRFRGMHDLGTFLASAGPAVPPAGVTTTRRGGRGSPAANLPGPLSQPRGSVRQR
jgi:hypothetical protein